MRFVIAIVTFVVAAVLIGVGFGQRTIWAPPTSVSAEATVPDGTRYIVIGGSTLNAIEGQQTLEVGGGASSPFVAYGRTADVLAWLGDESYTRLSYQHGALVAKSAKGDTPAGTPTATPAPGASAPATPAVGAGSGNSTSTDAATATHPDPDGSDLWLEQFTGASAGLTRMNVPDSVSVIIASDGAHPAPDKVRLTWPLSGNTPWAGPLIVLGGALLLTGLILYVFALRGMRRSRGPRRGGRPPRLPRAPRAPRVKAIASPIPASRGRRSVGRSLIAVPVVLVGALALSACSSQYWPTVGEHSTPTPSSTPIATELPGQADNPQPAVTSAQLGEIVARISQTAADADAKGDAALAATRFTGAALAARQVNYQVRAKIASYPAPLAIPANIELSLPQATDTWPRAVSVIVHDPKDTKTTPLDLVLTQQTPRDQYKVAYAISTEAGAKVPDLAPAVIGTSLVPPDSPLLKLAPNKLAGAYADILMNGDKSAFYKLFDSASDALAPQIGVAYKAGQISTVVAGGTSTLSYQDTPGADEPIALATVKSGALVATSLVDTAQQKVTVAGATVVVDKPDGPTAALTGKTVSPVGFQTSFAYQLLFYVPPVESGEKIRLLGFTQAAIAAKELQ